MLSEIEGILKGVVLAKPLNAGISRDGLVVKMVGRVRRIVRGIVESIIRLYIQFMNW